MRNKSDTGHKKTPPTALKAQLKLHKPDIPVRPVVNNRSAPAYKTAKKLNNILNQHLHLNNYYKINNSNELANNLTKLKINVNHRLIRLDIKVLEPFARLAAS
jgi:hypothetical protein